MTELDFIQDCFDAVSPYIKEKYASNETLEVSSKSGANDLLTEVDLAVQQEITRRIQDVYPHDWIIAEEAGLDPYPPDRNGRCWLIDPIDGTQNFVRGLFPAFGVSIAFAEGGAPQAAGVDIPIPGQRFLAEKGSGAFVNGARLKASDVKALDLARVEIDFANQDLRAQTLQQFSDVVIRAGQVRCHCACVIGLCSVAAAQMDAYFHVGLSPWDYAAGILIVEEAGGKTTRLDGAPIHLFDEVRGVLATNTLIHDECSAVIRIAG